MKMRQITFYLIKNNYNVEWIVENTHSSDDVNLQDETPFDEGDGLVFNTLSTI